MFVLKNYDLLYFNPHFTTILYSWHGTFIYIIIYRYIYICIYIYVYIYIYDTFLIDYSLLIFVSFKNDRKVVDCLSKSYMLLTFVVYIVFYLSRCLHLF